ncbi:sialin [Condylostylus longicornis]|uniref:sialin n=1 Tax=Condylostylus longicornis TaxID=2530218 RepID=UPI00244E4E07|nr:sialin [Condylostylus longicornis]
MIISAATYLKKYKPPTRFWVASMLFMACLLNYMMKVNFSINLVAMVEPTSNDSTPLPDYGQRYNWSQHDQANLLGAYFYGYLITSVPGGILAERFGGKTVAGATLAASAILTVLTPLSASLGMGAVFAVRFVIGLLGGATYPSCHNIISQWAPPDEKGKFVAALMGGTFGTVITLPLSAVIVESMGWNWAFYISGIFSFAICIIWFLVVADTPAKHKHISIDEQKYIEISLGENLSKKRKWPPFLKLLTSLPFIALLLLHYGNMWGLTFLITAAPKFLSEVLKFQLAKAGFLSSLPHLARLLLAFGFGAVADLIRRKSWLQTTKLRKSFCLFSHIIPGLFLILLGLVGRDPYVCVTIITLSLGFNGAASVTNLQNSQDLAPNYAGTLYGVINLFGTTPGFFSPLVVASFTHDENTLEQWKYVFFVGSAVYITPALFFMIFGTAAVQPWNFDKKNDDKTIELETGQTVAPENKQTVPK